jgi:cation diffusion facilitator CzcD-associated flavoprotein CzcO
VTEVVIVGAGFAGLCMGIKLKQAGIHDFVILERANSLGGTWRDNDYPGCACDIPAVLYSFSFEPSAEWSRVYPLQPEIQAYLEHCAEKYGLESSIRYDAEVSVARYDDAGAQWRLETTKGARYVARFLVSGMGGLSNPHIPAIPGIETFTGRSFHSATWDYGVALNGKNVAVIGTGASAIQFVPQVAPRAGRLSLYQRTPPWIVPKLDGRITPLQRTLRRRVPGYAWALRKLVYWLLEVRGLGFQGNERMLAMMTEISRKHLERQVPDRALRAKVAPDYQFGCKRVLLSNDYYPTLARPNVEVLTDPIERVDGDAIVTSDGVRRPADVIIYGTGFRAQDPIAPARVFGSDGVSIEEAWRGGMEAFLGISVAGFPNLFMLVGPNTGLGHNSMVFMIESQVRYIVSAIKYARKHKGRALDVKRDVQKRFNYELQGRLKGTVWAGGCRSWYLDRNGRNTALWPGFTFEYRARTKRIQPSRYTLRRPRVLPQ